MDLPGEYIYDAPIFREHPVPVKLCMSHYVTNNRLALSLDTRGEGGGGDEPGWEHFLMCTCNVVAEDCPDGEVWVKNWSENEGMTEWLIRNKIIEPEPTCNTQLDFAQAERYKLTADFLKLIAQELLS